MAVFRNWKLPVPKIYSLRHVPKYYWISEHSLCVSCWYSISIWMKISLHGGKVNGRNLDGIKGRSIWGFLDNYCVIWKPNVLLYKHIYVREYLASTLFIQTCTQHKTIYHISTALCVVQRSRRMNLCTRITQENTAYEYIWYLNQVQVHFCYYKLEEFFFRFSEFIRGNYVHCN